MARTGLHLHIYKNKTALIEAAARYWLDHAKLAITEHENFSVALSGGSTPKTLYQRLASEHNFDWQAVEFYFGDERCVPLDHVDSNYRMANEALFKNVNIAVANIHPMQCNDDHQQAASTYEQHIKNSLRLHNDLPCFDLVMLGMGEDGHTASLFPGTEILHEQRRLIAPVYVEAKKSWRLSFTYPLINNAGQIMILVNGSAKQAMLDHVFNQHNCDVPIRNLHPAGELHWFIDHDACPEKLPEHIHLHDHRPA